LAGCVCTNTTLRAQMSQCAQASCAYEDQMTRTSQDLCYSYPVPDRRNQIQVIYIVLPVISVFSVVLRCISRLSIAKTLWWDDWSAIISAAGLLRFRSMGLQRHYWDIDPSNAKPIVQILYVLMLYVLPAEPNLGIISAKSSICAFYLRIFIDRKFRLVTYLFFMVMMIHGLLHLFLIVFQCVPIRGIWDRSIDSRCLNVLMIGYTGAAGVILEDIVLIIMPVPELMKLQLKPEKKLALSLIFGLGSFATIASIIRLRYLVTYSRSYDPTWDSFDAALWSGIEVNAIITCGNLPALLPLIKRVPNALRIVQATTKGMWHKILSNRFPPPGNSQSPTVSCEQLQHSHSGTADSAKTPTEGGLFTTNSSKAESHT
ncbi:integral membrane protein, partial [Colletotrichum tofieldiae]